MYIRSIPAKFVLSTALGAAIILFAASAFNPAAAANRNTILDKLESAPSSWQSVDLDVNVNGTPDAPVALGQTVTINVTSSQPANFLLAIVDTYGNVRIARPEGTSNASYQYTAAEPVGSYSTYTFASDTPITDDTLGLPASGAESYLPIGVKGVDQFLATLTNHAGKLVRAEESRFFVEDENLTAMRGIKKSITKLKKNKPKVNTPVKSDPVQTSTPKVTVAQSTQPAIPAVAMIDQDSTTEQQKVVVDQTEPKIKVRTKIQPASSKPAAVNGGSLTLDIKFQFNSQELTQSGINALDTLGSALLGLQRSNELPKILLEGHTDDTGDGAYNLKLSQNRANSARDYLLNRFGLSEGIISAHGYGESAPKVANVDSKSREANRRVELRVVN